MSKNKDVWTLTNMSKETREIAKTLAHREGKTISSWVSEAVRLRANHQEIDVTRIAELIEERVLPLVEQRLETKGRFWWQKRT